MFAIFSNEYVLFGTIAAIALIGVIGWGKVGGKLFGGKKPKQGE
tara:strand:- start:724 stop:855 length:132 start_codon:yes stop_codon:yes gene_type:complete